LCAVPPIELYPSQFDFVTCGDRFSGFIGGIGSGKSFAGAVKSIAQATTPHLGMVTAPTYPMLRDATIRTFLDVAGDAVREFYKGEMRAVLAGGAEVLFRSVDDPDRLRGPNLAWWWGDEGSLYSPDVWPIMIGRLREGAGRAWITATPKGFNWLYQRRGEITLFRARTADNPYLPPDFIQSLQASYTGAYAKQELDGEFVTFEGLVYDEWSADNETNDEPDPTKPIELAFDDGYIDPRVILFIQRTSNGILVFDELYHSRHLGHVCIQEALDMLGSRFGWSNVRGQRRPLVMPQLAVGSPEAIELREYMRRADIAARGVSHRIVDGVQVVRRLVHDGNGVRSLRVHRRCANLLREIREGYQYPSGSRARRDEEQPLDKDNHACDALRYWCWLRARRA
jgi:PBSX family phage terminase large subunit